jgi:hypothetical protein
MGDVPTDIARQHTHIGNVPTDLAQVANVLNHKWNLGFSGLHIPEFP